MERPHIVENGSRYEIFTARNTKCTYKLSSFSPQMITLRVMTMQFISIKSKTILPRYQYYRIDTHVGHHLAVVSCAKYTYPQYRVTLKSPAAPTPSFPPRRHVKRKINGSKWRIARSKYIGIGHRAVLLSESINIVREIESLPVIL